MKNKYGKQTKMLLVLVDIFVDVYFVFATVHFLVVVVSLTDRPTDRQTDGQTDRPRWKIGRVKALIFLEHFSGHFYLILSRRASSGQIEECILKQGRSP